MVPTTRKSHRVSAASKSSIPRHRSNDEGHENGSDNPSDGAAASDGAHDHNVVILPSSPRRGKASLSSSTSQGTMGSRRKDKLQSDLRRLRDEMEVMIPQGGRRRTPKHQAKQRTRKRKVLEAQDLRELAVVRDTSKRLRGVRAAEEDVVIQGSLIFGTTPPAPNNANGNARAQQENECSSFQSEIDEDLVMDDEDVDDDDADALESGSDDDKQKSEGQDDVGSEDSCTSKTPEKSSLRVSRIRRPRKKTRMFRMRSFKSAKMTERHGDALAAFAQGQHREAIEKLQNVARELPSAPQVYSSLGMVYEEMLRDLRKRSDETAMYAIGEQSAANNISSPGGIDVNTESILSEQLAIAKKAYGSYHIAALLCKKDFTCWVRAGDLAVSIADLHGEIMTLRDLAKADSEHHRSEKQRWLSEAKNDYQTADAIQAPGIDIPAKLASVCMELGKLSEALTILTDMKNRAPTCRNRRSAFDVSYRAWWLYADLMLRIGYECIKWNGGDQTIGNSSFRRWLRRHSRNFDWEERRLQALGRALEAAAGSSVSRVFTDWLKRRADDCSNGDRVASTLTDSPCQEDTCVFENEVSLLRQKQATELADFDKTTREINLESNTVPTERRNKARGELLRRQEDALKELQQDFQGGLDLGHQPGPGHGLLATDLTTVSSLTEEPLMISASTKTVCGISSELLRHLLLLKAYDGGRLVGEVFALYLKKRASLFDKRVKGRRIFEENRLQESSVLHTVLSQRSSQVQSIREANSDSDSVSGFSDDEDLDCGPQEVIDALRMGCFPPEISVLYALCLMAEGGRDYIAIRHLQGIRHLEQESFSELAQYAIDTGVVYDARWTSFKRSRTAPLYRSAAFALVHDVLMDCERDVDLANRLTSLFDTQVKHLSDEGLLCDPFLSDNPEAWTECRVAIDKIATAAARFHLTKAEHLIAESKSESALKLLQSTATTLTSVLSASWKVYSDGSVVSSCVSIVETLARLFQIGTSLLKQSSMVGDWKVWASTIENAVSPLLGLNTEVVDGSPIDALPDVGILPISSAWLSGKRRALALSAYNLGVSLNVARFSGWERQEFSTALIRRRSHCSSHFGVTSSDGIVSGLLIPFEDEIIDQWEALQELLASRPTYSIRSMIALRRSSPWYQEAQTMHCAASQQNRLFGYGEESGLSLLLAFSRASIKSAESGDQATRSGSLANSLSVLAPLLQFALKYNVWDANIGVATSSKSQILEWKYSTTNEEKKESEVQGSRARRKRTPQSTEDITTSLALHVPFPGERSVPISSNLIVVPCRALHNAWTEGMDRQLLIAKSAPSEHMVVLSQYLRQLRGCHTEKAVEGASLNVAVAAIDLMAHPECSNPFLCMQLAAFYASQAPKRGSSDKAFKNALPRRENCTPLDALTILARAECLQALHFCTEAAFLCDFVARVSRTHPIGSSSDPGLQRRWSIVRAAAYNVSVSIRHTAVSLRNDNYKPSDPGLPFQWQQPAIDELMRGREECVAFLKNVTPISVDVELPLREAEENGSECSRSPKIEPSPQTDNPSFSDDEGVLDFQLVPV